MRKDRRDKRERNGERERERGRRDEGERESIGKEGGRERELQGGIAYGIQRIQRIRKDFIGKRAWIQIEKSPRIRLGKRSSYKAHIGRIGKGRAESHRKGVVKRHGPHATFIEEWVSMRSGLIEN